jgi:amino acid permease
MTEYWLASLKVGTIVVFIIVGLLVNVGVNSEHEFIGLRYWRIPGAPFVGGIGGFARVFVTAGFACESVNGILVLELTSHLFQTVERRVWVSPQGKRRIQLATCRGL